jgi:hypothetical protein
MAKTTTDGGVDAPRRKRLEALRDDCRRHDQCAVEIVFAEYDKGDVSALIRPQPMAVPYERLLCRALRDGRIVVAALRGEDKKAEKNAVAYLARLGRELAEMKFAGVSDFADLESLDLDSLAMLELAGRAPARKSWVPPMPLTEPPPMPEADHLLAAGEMTRRVEEGWKAAGFIEKTERKVPDVRAAIAELCDELLEVKLSAAAPKRKRADPGALWLGAVKTLRLMRQAGKDPSDADVARAIGVSTATFSRHVGSKPAWTDERAGRLGTARRQASRDPDTWADR